jgi:DNA-binding FrmR family transcriptional regulator
MPTLIGAVDTHLASVLRDVIDMHLEGVVAAKQATMDDPTVASAEELLDLMSGYDDDMKILLDFRKRLDGE